MNDAVKHAREHASKSLTGMDKVSLHLKIMRLKDRIKELEDENERLIGVHMAAEAESYEWECRAKANEGLKNYAQAQLDAVYEHVNFLGMVKDAWRSNETQMAHECINDVEGWLQAILEKE